MYIRSVRFGLSLLTNCSQIPEEQQGQTGVIGDGGQSLQVQEGRRGYGKGPKGTQPVRLLTARLWVRVPPPEPVQLLRDSESGTQSDSGGGFGSHLGVSGRTSEAVKAALQ